MNPQRRAVLLGLGGAALAGCAAPGSAVYQVFDSYRALNRAKENYPVTQGQIDAQPLGVLGVQVEGGLKGLVVWEKAENDMDHWRSGNDVRLVTANGRLISTQGFPRDQLASRVLEGVDPLGLPLEPSRQYEWTRVLSHAPDRVEVIAQHRLSYAQQRSIRLLEKEVIVEEWQEVIRLSRRSRPWKQLIQVDAASGRVMRSIQHVGPEMRVILELLKAPGPSA